MKNIKQYIQKLFEAERMTVSGNRMALFDEFIAEEKTAAAVQQIIDNQKMLMQSWQLKSRIADIIQQPAVIPNGTVGKPYSARLDFDKWGWNDIAAYKLEGLEGLGLEYDQETGLITGTPVQSGDIKLTFRFRLKGEAEDAPFNEKKMPVIINPDPKSLWKTIDSNREEIYWKEDNVAVFEAIGDRHVVAASKRGRSHANAGSFRDDDFAFRHYEATGWNIIAIADGAGSAKLSREGSRLACATVVSFFEDYFTTALDQELETLLAAYTGEGGEAAQKGLSSFIYQHLGKGAYAAHQKIAELAAATASPLKDFHTTLAFTLFKNYGPGTAFLSFGVGDCPMVLLNKELTDVTLLNALDVGAYSGGTRFITMTEIFGPEAALSARFRFKYTTDFGYLIAMSDGIYDPKFSVEAALDKPERWKDFMADLEGSNEGGTGVALVSTNENITAQLSAWMDFWSAGNHDDRTLVIVF